LNKRQLLENWQGEASHCRVFLYLFPAALERFLTRQLGRLEAHLWGSSPAYKVILLVPDREIWLDGQYLAVLGGSQIGNWQAVVPQKAPDAKQLLAMYQTCRDTLRWQESWLQSLTPLHLKVNGRALPDDRTANALRVHLANLIILYTADRTVVRTDGQWLATYTGATQRIELILGKPQDRLEEEASAGVAPLLQMVEWAYDAQWTDNRLPLVQIGVAQALSAVDPMFRYRQLLRNAASIFDGLQWNWKAFVEGKVDAYMTQLRALEDYVASTVQAFADQISAMIKGLSDTMLAAVGALLGSFIAALFKDKFNATIFSIGMLVYAVYVLVFPLGYNMLHQWQRYRVLVKDFQTRYRRFEEQLYPQKVSEIAGTQIPDSQKRFRHWFTATLLSYVAVIILTVLAAILLPGLVATTILPLSSMPAL
jgi:hypothetical protein